MPSTSEVNYLYNFLCVIFIDFILKQLLNLILKLAQSLNIRY